MQYNSNIYILIYLVIGTIILICLVITSIIRQKIFNLDTENSPADAPFIRLLIIIHILALIGVVLYVPVKYRTSDLVLNVENAEIQLEETGSNDYYMMIIHYNNGNIKQNIEYFMSKQNAKPLLNTKVERISQIKCQLLKRYTIFDIQFKNKTELINITIQ